MAPLIFTICLFLFFLISLVLYRAAIGPSSLDRIIAVNVVGTKTTVLLILIGFLEGHVEMFVDLALTYAILSFIGSVAIARFVKARVTKNMWEALGLRLKSSEEDPA